MSNQPWTLNSHQVSVILSKQLDAAFGIAVCIAAFIVFREGVWGGVEGVITQLALLNG
jgi:hypothetical protein